MAASLKIAGIRKVYGKADKAVEVLKKIDIDVAPGEFLILVGPSGCGKSTLLNIIAGLEEPSEGQLLISGKDVVGVAPAQRCVAIRKAAKAGNDVPVLRCKVAVACQLGFERVRRIKRQLAKARHAVVLQGQVFSVHERHQQKHAAHPGQLSIPPVGQRIGHQLLRTCIA